MSSNKSATAPSPKKQRVAASDDSNELVRLAFPASHMKRLILAASDEKPLIGSECLPLFNQAGIVFLLYLATLALNRAEKKKRSTVRVEDLIASLDSVPIPLVRQNVLSKSIELKLKKK